MSADQWAGRCNGCGHSLALTGCQCPSSARVSGSGERLTDEQVPVVRGYRVYDDGSRSPVERWVRRTGGSWVSLDSERATHGDIVAAFCPDCGPTGCICGPGLVEDAARRPADEDRLRAIAERAIDAIGTGGHSHWRTGGTGGRCGACERVQAQLRDDLRAVLARHPEGRSS